MKQMEWRGFWYEKSVVGTDMNMMKIVHTHFVAVAVLCRKSTEEGLVKRPNTELCTVQSYALYSPPPHV